METILLIVIVAAVGAYAALVQSRSGKTGTTAEPDRTSPRSQTEDASMSKPRKTKATAPVEAPLPQATEAAAPASVARTAEGTGLLQGIKTWGYQLQKVNTKDVAASAFDMMVIDYSKDGSDEKAFSPGDIQRMKHKPDGGRRQVIAYMSIGEAEDYRYYWDPVWKQSKPGWLLEENPDWKGNYSVCYWEAGWQSTFCGNPAAYLDKIIAAGFDGVYLDKCDVFEDLQNRNKKIAASREDMEGDMVAFIQRLSHYAKSRKPPFVVIMQNAEVLLEHEALRQAIDGVAKESLLYGQPGPEKPNPKDEVTFARRALDLARSAGRTVFVVEYLNDAAKIREATGKLDGYGYVSTISPKSRKLDHLNTDPATV
jgi:cysteinyl-tRNA synthetase, unknown class